MDTGESMRTLVIGMLLIAGCAVPVSLRSSVQPYPTAGQTLAQQDVDDRYCSAVAGQAANSGVIGGDAAVGAVSGAAVGAAGGALYGSWYGYAGRDAGIGAGVGALTGLIGGLASEAATRTQNAHVAYGRCMAARGYAVNGYY